MLNPMHSEQFGPDVPFARYRDGIRAKELVAKDVAKEIRIVHLPFPWGEEEGVKLGAGREYDYPGFEIFNEGE